MAVDFACSVMYGRFFFKAEDGIRDRSPSRGLGDVYKRQAPALQASPSGEAAAPRRLMRAEFAWSPFNGQYPQALPASVRGRGRGHLLPQGEKLSLVHIFEPKGRPPMSCADFCLKKNTYPRESDYQVNMVHTIP